MNGSTVRWVRHGRVSKGSIHLACRILAEPSLAAKESRVRPGQRAVAESKGNGDAALRADGPEGDEGRPGVHGDDRIANNELAERVQAELRRHTAVAGDGVGGRVDEATGRLSLADAVASLTKGGYRGLRGPVAADEVGDGAGVGPCCVRCGGQCRDLLEANHCDSDCEMPNNDPCKVS